MLHRNPPRPDGALLPAAAIGSARVSGVARTAVAAALASCIARAAGASSRTALVAPAAQ